MSPHSSPQKSFGEDQSPDPGDGGNRAYVKDTKLLDQIANLDSYVNVLTAKKSVLPDIQYFFICLFLKLAQAAVLLILFHALPPARYTAVSETWTNT